MAKKIKSKTSSGNFKFKASLVVVLLGIIVIGIFIYVFNVRLAQQEASVIPISQLMVNGADTTKAPAPVDPKTGDVYFPQAKLYLPAPASLTQLTYSYYEDDNAEPHLEITSKSIFLINANQILVAQTSDEAFKRVPKLQACQRGVQFEYVKRTDSVEPIEVIRLNNGKDLYMYTEPLCPELSELYDVLKTIQSY